MSIIEPEKKMQAISEAAAALESKVVVDTKFPDLSKTFTDPANYAADPSDVYQPIVLKRNTTLPVDGLTDMAKFDHNSPCGICPAINRAYFVVKNHLYLWNYEDSLDLKTHTETDEIVGVGFVKPKPGVFSDKVKQLMVIATTSVIKIICVVINEKSLEYADPNLMTLANGVRMTQIISSSNGRIFMVGDDSHVWELDYKSQETWFSSKCRKILLTNPSALGFLFPKSRDAIVQIVVNESGTVMYQLTKNSTIQVVYLGNDGSSYQPIYTKTDCIADAKRSSPTSEYLTPNSHIVSIHTTKPTESSNYHLVAVTSNGGRIYYNNQKDFQPLNYDNKPTGLVIMHYRNPSKSLAPTDLVSKPLYRNALAMFVRNPQNSETQSQIVTYCPNLANLANNILSNSNIQLTENTNTIDIHGKVLAIVESPTGIDDINEFKYTYRTTARHFLVLTTSGITILVKQRPVDMLHNLVKTTGQDTLVRIRLYESFFVKFGYLNVTSLCFDLIAMSPSTSFLEGDSVITDRDVKGAEILLKHFGQVTSALLDVNNRSYSSLHDGLALYIYRVVQGVWNKPLIKETFTSHGKVYSNNISKDDLNSIINILKTLQQFIDKNESLFLLAPNAPESKSLNNILVLIKYLTEAFTYFSNLFEEKVDSIIKLGQPASQQNLLQFDLKRLLTTSEGSSIISSGLTSPLIEYTNKRYNSTEYVIDVLTSICGSFCNSQEIILHNVANQLFSACNTNPTQARAILKDTYATLNKIAAGIPASKASELANQFFQYGHPVYGIGLALQCAKHRDPLNAASAYFKAKCPAGDSRIEFYKAKQPFYNIALDILKKVVKNTPNLRKEAMQTTFDQCPNDIAFQYYAYNSFIKDGLAQALIDEKPPNLESYLQEPFEYSRLKLLAAYYRSCQAYEKAAKTYYILARTPFPNESISDDERLTYLGQAQLCAKSVTAPKLHFEMNNLLNDISGLIDNFAQQIKPTTEIA